MVASDKSVAFCEKYVYLMETLSDLQGTLFKKHCFISIQTKLKFFMALIVNMCNNRKNI